MSALDPSSLDDAAPFLGRHADVFLQHIRVREAVMRKQFDAIDRLGCALTFDECRDIAARVLTPHVGKK